MAENQNSIVNLVELLLSVTKIDTDAEIEVRVELRINAADLDDDDGTSFNVGLKRMWLSLDLSGLSVSTGTRLGEPVKPNEVDFKKEISSERTVEKQASGGGGFSITQSGAKGSLEGGASLSGKEKTTISKTASESAQHIRVKARGGGHWEVSEANAELLDGTYLDNDLLCRVVATKGANSQTVELCAFAKQKDVALNVTRDGRKFTFLNVNQERLLKILISKALSSNGSRYSGTIVFSKSDGEVEE